MNPDQAVPDAGQRALQELAAEVLAKEQAAPGSQEPEQIRWAQEKLYNGGQVTPPAATVQQAQPIQPAGAVTDQEDETVLQIQQTPGQTIQPTAPGNGPEQPTEGAIIPDSTPAAPPQRRARRTIMAAEIGDILVVGQPGYDRQIDEWVDAFHAFHAFHEEAGYRATFFGANDLKPPFDQAWEENHKGAHQLIRAELLRPSIGAVVYVNGIVDGRQRTIDRETKTHGCVHHIGYAAFNYALAQKKPRFVSHELPMTAVGVDPEGPVAEWAAATRGLGVKALHGTYDLNAVMAQQGEQ